MYKLCSFFLLLLLKYETEGREWRAQIVERGRVEHAQNKTNRGESLSVKMRDSKMGKLRSGQPFSTLPVSKIQIFGFPSFHFIQFKIIILVKIIH